MATLQDLTGQVFDRLRVVRRVTDSHYVKWWCQCDCGKMVAVRANHILAGASRSCGCLRAGNHLQHGGRHTTEYQSWAGMRQRCHNPRNPNFKNYGARGIRVFEQWQRSFAAFRFWVGPSPSPQHSIDRIDNDGHYEPGNVRWATPKEQNANRRVWKRRTV